MRPDIIAGAIFPDYQLTDHTGKRQRLSDLQAQDPLILVLGRGGYCPKDRGQHEALVELHRELEVGYCRPVIITTDNITETNEFRTGVGAHWPFLSDAGRKIQSAPQPWIKTSAHLEEEHRPPPHLRANNVDPDRARSGLSAELFHLVCVGLSCGTPVGTDWLQPNAIVITQRKQTLLNRT
jgi:peroxiredoxin